MPIVTPGEVPDPAPLQLTNVTVDYDAVRDAYTADLRRQGSWSNLLPVGTGSALIRWISSAITFLQGGIARALQENYSDTARTPGGILRAQRLFQGSTIIRRRASGTNVALVRNDTMSGTLTVPPLNAWRVGGALFYNRSPVVVPGNGSTTARLYNGTIATTTVTTDGTPFQRFVLGEPNAWNIGNDDLVGTDASGVAWTQTDFGGLWKAEGDARVFRASTQPDGTVEILFGMGEDYGAIPPVGTFVFTYALVVSAQDSISTPPLGSTVLPSSSAYTLQGTTTSVAAPNQDRPPPEFYKSMGPGNASNNGRSITLAEYRAEALKYDGVVDAVFRPQRLTNPSDVRWMNIVAVTLLTDRPWSSADWIDFKAYFEEEVAISNVYLIRVDPTPVRIDVNVEVGSTTIADNTSLENVVRGVLMDYFTPRAGIIGMTLMPSDVSLGIAEKATYQQAPNEAGELVDYVDLKIPRMPVVLGPTSYPTGGNIAVNVVRSTRGANNRDTGPVLGA